MADWSSRLQILLPIYVMALSISLLMDRVAAVQLKVSLNKKPFVAGKLNAWLCTWMGQRPSTYRLEIRNKTGNGAYGPVLANSTTAVARYDFVPKRCDVLLTVKCDRFQSGAVKETTTTRVSSIAVNPNEPELKGPSSIPRGELGTWQCSVDGSTQYFPTVLTEFQNNGTKVSDVCSSCVATKKEKHKDDCQNDVYKVVVTIKLRPTQAFRLMCTSDYGDAQRSGAKATRDVTLGVVVTAAKPTPPPTSPVTLMENSTVPVNGSDNDDGGKGDGEDAESMDNLKLWLGVAGGLFVLMIITCFAAAFCLRRRPRKKQPPQAGAMEMNYPHPSVSGPVMMAAPAMAAAMPYVVPAVSQDVSSYYDDGSSVYSEDVSSAMSYSVMPQPVYM